MHVHDTMARPDNDATILAVAERLRGYILEGEARKGAPPANHGPSSASTTPMNSALPDELERMKKLKLNSSSLSSGDNAENAPPSSGQTTGSVVEPAAEEGPSVREVAKYLHMIFTTAQCSVDCTIVCLIYVERLLAMERSSVAFSSNSTSLVSGS